jgi:hypothetical protein
MLHTRWLVDLSTELRPIIRDVAVQEERGDAQMVRILLRQALRARGLLPPVPTKPISSDASREGGAA